MDNVVWKDIPGYEGLYQVSNDGRVKSLSKFHNTVSNGYIQKERIMKINRRGKYQCIGLLRNGKYEYFLIHRLVATVFISNPENKPCVNHKDNNGCNNTVENLEWCTYSENSLHANRVAKVCTGMTGKHHSDKSKRMISEKRKGRKPPNAAFSKEEVIDIRTRKNQGEKRRNVYADYKDKITKSGFQNVWYGRAYKEVVI